MRSRNHKRAAILDRLNRSTNVRQIMKDMNLTAGELGDAMLRIEATLVALLGGPASFTGKTRTYSNGTIGYEVRCRQCRQAFWVTAVPMACCPDCDRDSGWR